jgi:EmrB/QacA subfamily drug resistance transporter
MSREIKIALLMAASLFMEILDGTIVTTALPKMARDFATSTTTISLLVSIYLMTTAVFIPLSGWMANRFGQKRIWLLAVLIFTLSSLGNALAPTLPILLMMRLTQGISAALMTPTARLIVLEKTPTHRLLKMTSYLVWPALIAPTIAPVVGGAIVTHWTWQGIFLINLPIGLVIMLIGLILIPKNENLRQAPFDLVGFIGIAITSVAVLFGLDLATHGTLITEMTGVGIAILGAVGLIPIYYHLQKVEHPLFSVSALKLKSFRMTQTGGSFLWLSVGAMPFLLTIFLQNIFHWSALKAGSYIIFIFLGNLGIKPFTTVIIRKLSYKGALLASFMMILLSALGMVYVTPSMAPLIMILAMISGVGRSLALTSYTGLNFSEVPVASRNSANTLGAVIQTLAQGVGISLISVIIHLLNLSLTMNWSYRLGFVFLALFMIYPIFETLGMSKKMGMNTL